jgi:hypothetical protein
MNYRRSRLKGILENELRNLSCLPAPRVPRYQNNLNENKILKHPLCRFYHVP